LPCLLLLHITQFRLHFIWLALPAAITFALIAAHLAAGCASTRRMSEPSTSASPAASSSSSAPQRGNDAQRAHNARAQHGNFHAYYHIRAAPAVPDAAVAAASAAAGDPRVPLILEELQRQRGERQWPLRLLDVGCNAGKMTFALGEWPARQDH
jgi:hypothetical protein